MINFLEKLKNKDTKNKKRKLKAQIKKENNSQNEIDTLIKLKPREYKNIQDKENKELNYNYDYAKERREYIEDKIKKIEKMASFEYLNFLNEETKEKLIGLCLVR